MPDVRYYAAAALSDEGDALREGPLSRVTPRALAASGDAALRERVRLAVAENGRVVIPKPLRDAMRLDEGGMLTAFLDEDGVLMLVTPGAAIAKAQRMARLLDRGEGSVVDELIAERRAEAGREDGA